MESARDDKYLVPLKIGSAKNRLGLLDMRIDKQSEDLVGALLLAGGEEALESGGHSREVFSLRQVGRDLIRQISPRRCMFRGGGSLVCRMSGKEAGSNAS